MQAASLADIRKELKLRSPKELNELCLALARFKKENKELLTYLLYEASNEAGYIESVKSEIDRQFDEISSRRYYIVKKNVRKILRGVKKYIRYSKKKPTEVELLLHFSGRLKELNPPISRNTTLLNLYNRQIAAIKKIIPTLHEDLQYDYQMELENL